jgi:hypothetical protein
LFKSPIQKQEFPLAAMFLNGSGQNYRGPSIDASYKVSVLLDKRFQRIFLEPDQSETKIACGGHAHKRIGTKYAIFIADIP